METMIDTNTMATMILTINSDMAASVDNIL